MSKRNRLILIFGVLIVICVLLLAAFWGRKDRGDTSAEVVVKDNVKVITAETDVDYQPISVSESTMTFSHDPEYDEGDVIVAGIMTAAPDGFIRKVVGVHKQDGVYTYETEYAVLTDVFEKAHIAKYFRLTKDGIREMDDPDQTVSQSDEGAQSSGVVPLSCQLADYQDTAVELLSAMPLSDDDREPLFSKEFEGIELSKGINASGEIGFDVWVEVFIDIEFGDIDFGVVVHTKSTGELFLGCQREVFDKDNDEGEYTIDLCKMDLPNFQFYVGFIPIIITNEFKATIETSVQLEGTLGTTVSVASERISGFGYTSATGEIREINEKTYLGDGIEWQTEASAAGKAEAGIYAHLITKLYGCTGADLSIGIMGGVDGEVGVYADDIDGSELYGELEYKAGPKAEGSIVVSIPIIDKKLANSPIFTVTLPMFIEGKWENHPSAPATDPPAEEDTEDDDINTSHSFNNTVITKRQSVYMVTCPEFALDYPDNWKIVKEELEGDYEWIVLENDRGVQINYYQSNNGFGSPYYGGADTLVYANITKAADSAFTPGYVQAVDYSSLGKFAVVKLKEYATEDGYSDVGKVEIDGSTIYAVVPESYIGETVYMGMGYWPVLSWEYPSPIAMLVTAPDGRFTLQEEQEVIQILSTFREN